MLVVWHEVRYRGIYLIVWYMPVIQGRTLEASWTATIVEDSRMEMGGNRIGFHSWITPHPYLRVATINLLNLAALLFRWTQGVESRFSAWSQRWLLGEPLHRSTPMKAHATLSFLLQWCIFFRPTGHYVRDNYCVLSNMAPVYHIVVVRVIWTSWAYVRRLHFRFIGMGYDNKASVLDQFVPIVFLFVL
jgi:hypothetical protein